MASISLYNDSINCTPWPYIVAVGMVTHFDTRCASCVEGAYEVDVFNSIQLSDFNYITIKHLIINECLNSDLSLISEIGYVPDRAAAIS